MKFAFSTIACPGWDFQNLVARAKEFGYDGVELRSLLNETDPIAANVFLSEPGKIQKLFAGAGIEIACISSSIAMTGDRRADQRSADECRRYIDSAAAVGCGMVKILDTSVPRRSSRTDAAVALAKWLSPLAEYAAQRRVTLLVENALSFRTAKELWMVLEQVNHPALAVCWDVFNAAVIGESPNISVPTLNSKIQFVHVRDALIKDGPAVPCAFGEGDVPLAILMQRLMGIGYAGYVSVESDKAWLTDLAAPEVVLPAALKKLKQWIAPPVKAAPAPKPAAAKEAIKKPAPAVAPAAV